MTPDRYGDDGYADALPPAERAQLRADAIARCNLCDTDGYRRSAVCDHRDYTDTAKRGIELVRRTMGWSR